jgi:hypothetical protein
MFFHTIGDSIFAISSNGKILGILLVKNQISLDYIQFEDITIHINKNTNIQPNSVYKVILKDGVYYIEYQISRDMFFVSPYQVLNNNIRHDDGMVYYTYYTTIDNICLFESNGRGIAILQQSDFRDFDEVYIKEIRPPAQITFARQKN